MPSRADRLRTSVLLFGLVNQPATDALTGSRDAALLAAEEWDAWRSSDDEDTALARACIEAERERRDRQWTALELLCHAYTGPEAPDHTDPQPRPRTGAKPAGTATETPTVESVPRAAIIATTQAILGWYPQPGGE